MKPVLLLDSGFTPLQVISWETAVTLIFKQRARVVEEYDEVIRSPSFEMLAPSVIYLTRFARTAKKGGHRGPKFSRPNVYRRDAYTCAYCNRTYAGDRLTFDHVIPASRGGATSWENVTTACRTCNERKANRTPAEAGLTLSTPPSVPNNLPLVDPGSMPDPRWANYL